MRCLVCRTLPWWPLEGAIRDVLAPSVFKKQLGWLRAWRSFVFAGPQGPPQREPWKGPGLKKLGLWGGRDPPACHGPHLSGAGG